MYNYFRIGGQDRFVAEFLDRSPSGDRGAVPFSSVVFKPPSHSTCSRSYLKFGNVTENGDNPVFFVSQGIRRFLGTVRMGDEACGDYLVSGSPYGISGCFGSSTAAALALWQSWNDYVTGH